MDNAVNNQVLEHNSPTLLMEDNTSRFSSVIWADKIKTTDIIIGGAGGIGSWLCLLLSRVQPNSIKIYDNDRVDGSNLSGQFYSSNNVGSAKVNAIGTAIMNYSKYYDTYARYELYSISSDKKPIMMGAFDNMEARKVFYHNWKSNLTNCNKNEALFIDGRLASEYLQVFCIRGDDKYHQRIYEENWLFNDSDAEETICSNKQTSHCANMIASIMVNLFTNFVANQCNSPIPRDLPFFTSYDASLMYFKTES